MTARPGQRIEKTEALLRWVEAQRELPRAFAFPTPAQAGLLAAVRLRFTDYLGQPITGELPLVRQCEGKGWLEVRAAKSGQDEQVKLTTQGRLVLDAVLDAGWPVPK